MRLPTASTLYFGTTAAGYESTRTSSDIWQVENDAITPVLRTVLRPREHVLDVAAGTGRWLDLYKAANVRPILLDISPDMLGVAAEHAISKHMSIEIITGNILEMSSLPPCDWLICTRFFNWIPLSQVTAILRLAASSGIKQFAFTVRCLDHTTTVQKRMESLWHWHKKNFDAIRGTRKKGLYYLQSQRRLRKAIQRAGLQVAQEHVIERVRGDVYLLMIVTVHS